MKSKRFFVNPTKYGRMILGVFFFLGKPEEALGNFFTALDMRLRLTKNDREASSVQDILLCIGIIYHQLAHFREALESYNEVIKTRTKLLGAQHPDTRHAVELLKQVCTF